MVRTYYCRQQGDKKRWSIGIPQKLKILDLIFAAPLLTQLTISRELDTGYEHKIPPQPAFGILFYSVFVSENDIVYPRFIAIL